MAKNVYQMVTDRVIEQMQQGIIPWHRPWTGAADGAMNYVTRRPYSLLNQLLLGRDGEWLTWKQIQDCGGKLKKGAKAGMVVYYGKFVAKKEKEDGTVDKPIGRHPADRKKMAVVKDGKEEII